MTAVSPTTAAFSPARPLTADIDASTRAPVLLLAFHSILWLVVSLGCSFLSTLKLHAPTLLSSCPCFTYGRLVAAADSVFIYGFASQAAMAVALWLICRLGGTRLVGVGAAMIGGLFWNLGTLVGLAGILAGGLTPFEHLQFPRYAIAVLLIAFLAYGVSALLTFANRAERRLYPSLWFILSGLIFFPWVLATVMMTLWSPTVRSTVTPIIAGWAANNIITVWLGSIALASIYYFLPKTTGRALNSNALAIFSFWLYIIFGQSTGMHFISAVPAWVQGLSEVASLLLLLPIFATAINLHSTVKGAGIDTSSFKLARWSIRFLVLFGILAAVSALAPLRNMLQFTLFQTGLQQLFLLGFVTCALFAAYHHILPTLCGAKPQRSIHVNLTVAGSILVFGLLIVSGFIQGGKVSNVQNDFLDAVKSAVGPTGGAMIGYLLLIVAQFALLAATGRSLCASCCKNTGGAR
jgi:cytochrome c oxidase cbb3-type subunit 1